MVADIVADMEVEMVDDMEVDKVADMVANRPADKKTKKRDWLTLSWTWWPTWR